MIYLQFKPSPDLAAVIRHFWFVEYDGTDAEPEIILPDGCPEIVFNLGDRFRRFSAGSSEIQPATLIAGQITRRIVIRPTGFVKLFGVRLVPTGAFDILRVSQNEFRDMTPDIHSVYGKSGETLEEIVNLATSVEERIAAVESFVRKRLVQNENCNTVTRAAVKLIEQSTGTVPIASLARYLNRSERSLERDFRERVGIAPKMLARIARFQNVVRMLESASSTPMSDTALSNGYFDQSHMIRDFQEFAGMSPGEFFNRTHALSDHFTSGG